ncbi:DNA-processing protein DprA [Specibacter sp. NPDC057265]|uniref:DNA-processing protein DprA n=1 Tax=Specibacter sp. NPDC057265 TaxID=3346075 RepID=UPI003635444E
MEPSDFPGLALIEVLGPEEALAFIASGQSSHAKIEQEMSVVLAAAGTERWPGLSEVLQRWWPRLRDAGAQRDVETVKRLGGGFLVPEDPQWPQALQDLQLGAPIGLWFRGAGLPIPAQGSCIAVVGSRDSTSYGANVASEITSSLVQRNFTVVSGGAYGIDAHAHRGALSAAGTRSGAVRAGRGDIPAVNQLPTLAVMAGGVDRFYPSGNEELLRAVARQGLIVAEVPPGTNPTRYRFLQRNRLIAALCAMTVVVEARWRSGALNTAHHAEQLSRLVGAVPGSVYSANSAGCHRLLKEGAAVCVSDAADIAELAGGMGEHLVVEPVVEAALHDGLGTSDLMVLDALPLHVTTSVEKLCVVAGLGATTILAGLGRLEALGLAERRAGGWKRGVP